MQVHADKKVSPPVAAGAAQTTSAPRAQLKTQLRGQSYRDGADALSPAVQRKKESGGATTVSAGTDPRLQYPTNGKDAEGAGLDATLLPYRHAPDPIPGIKGEVQGWNSQEILQKLSQLDQSNDTETDEVRCAANSALAIAIMAGPDQTAKFGERVASRATSKLARMGKKADPDLRKRVVKAMVTGMLSPAVIGLGMAKYGDLSELAEGAKVVMSKDVQGYSTGKELRNMQRGAGSTLTIGRQMKSKAQLEKYMKRLKPGDAYTVHVDTDTLGTGTKPAVAQGNHFVTIGKELGKDGKIYLYDPYPRTGSQMMYKDDAGFWTLFETKDGRWKWSMLIARTRPRHKQKLPEKDEP